MTTNVAYHLRWLVGPWLFAVIHLAHVYLRMSDSAHNTEFQAFFVTVESGQESRFVVVGERSTQGVAHLIAKRSDARHLPRVGLHSQFFLRIGARTCTPSLTIYIYGGVYLLHFGLNKVHRFDVVNTHEIYAKPVDVVLFHPMLHRFYHKLAHQGLFAGRFVAAARPVGIRSIGTFTIEVVGPGALECTARKVVGVVVNHVENNTYASLMQRLHHLFKLAYARFGAIGIGAVRAFGHVIVQRIVAPIILRFV